MAGVRPDGAAVGGRVELTFRNSHPSAQGEAPPERYASSEGSSIAGRITRCDPPRILSYSWGGESADSEITFELTARDGDVLLVLTHRRLGDRAAMVSVAGGWHTHLGILADQLGGHAPRPFWSTHAELDAEYEKRLPAD
jgi:uncharacterized protein YndB with AHSA1/START domain